MTKIESFIFHIEWRNVLRGLPDKVRLEVYDAIIDYGLSGTLPQLKSTAMLAFNIMKVTIDNDNRKYLSICERNRKNGLKGGRPKNPNKPKKPSGLSGLSDSIEKHHETSADKGVPQEKPNGFLGFRTPTATIEKEAPLFPPDEENAPITPKEVNPLIPPKKKVRVIPTLDEVKEYITEKGYPIDAEHFWNFYEANGWVQGRGKPIKKWKSCLTTWLKRRNDYGTTCTSQRGNEDHPSNEQVISDMLDNIAQLQQQECDGNYGEVRI